MITTAQMNSISVRFDFPPPGLLLVEISFDFVIRYYHRNWFHSFAILNQEKFETRSQLTTADVTK